MWVQVNGPCVVLWFQEHGLDASQYLIALKYISSFMSLACNAATRLLYVPYEVRAWLWWC